MMFTPEHPIGDIPGDKGISEKTNGNPSRIIETDGNDCNLTQEQIDFIE